MNVLFLFLIAIAIKFLLNISRLIGTYFCYGKFKQKSKNLNQLIPLVESLFNSAGTNVVVCHQSNKTDMMYLMSNFLADKDYKHHIDNIFSQTIGAYKLRLFQCINPFYWLFLPKYLLDGLKIFLPKTITAILHLAYWILAAAASYYLELYLETCGMSVLDYMRGVLQ